MEMVYGPNKTVVGWKGGKASVPQSQVKNEK